MDLTTSVADIPLKTCLYNASGPRSGTAAALHKVATSKSGAVLTKSATLEKQAGNPMPRTWHGSAASLNSEGLPNNGIDYYVAEDTYKETMEGEDKPYFVSLSGKTMSDNLAMLAKVVEASIPIAAVEINLACPNVIGKPIIAYDFDQLRSILAELKAFAKKNSNCPPLGVKMPPYLDMMHFQEAASILNEFKDTIHFVATINTLGNALSIDIHAEMPNISSNQGFAGLSGPAVKFTALANVKKMRELLDDEIDVVGVGGITSGQDLFEMLLVGASACQTATAHWKEGPVCFGRILKELEDLMRRKGYTTIKDFQGKMNTWSKDLAAASRKEAKKQVLMHGSGGTDKRSNKEGVFMMLAVFFFAVSGVLLIDKLMEEMAKQPPAEL